MLSISNLQPLRHAQVFENYLSGFRKYNIPKYDGKKRGIAKFWYSDGLIEKEIEFYNDKLSGCSCYYRDDGSLLTKFLFKEGVLKNAAAYTYEGVKVMEINIVNEHEIMKIWLWNNKALGSIRVTRNKFLRTLSILKILISINFIKIILKSIKPSVEREGLQNMLAAISSFEACYDDVFRVQKQY